MSVDKSTVVRIAELARIKVPEAELEKLAGEMAKILEWVAQLNEVDTEGVEPTGHSADLESVMRDDKVAVSRSIEDVLANAPQLEGVFIRVRAVLE